MTRKISLLPLINGAVLFTININNNLYCLGAPSPARIDTLQPVFVDCRREGSAPTKPDQILPAYQWVITSPQGLSSKVPLKK